jgi:hypothetical protein
MRPGPSIALKLLAGITALALSVRGWHSPEMAVLGAGLFLRAGFDLDRRRPTNAPPIPLRRTPVLPPAGPARSGGRATSSEGAARVAAWAKRDRRTDPAQVRLDRDWLAAQAERTSATAATSAPRAASQPRPAVLTPGVRPGRIGPIPATRTTGSEDP